MPRQMPRQMPRPMPCPMPRQMPCQMPPARTFALADVLVVDGKGRRRAVDLERHAVRAAGELGEQVERVLDARLVGLGRAGPPERAVPRAQGGRRRAGLAGYPPWVLRLAGRPRWVLGLLGDGERGGQVRADGPPGLAVARTARRRRGRQDVRKRALGEEEALRQDAADPLRVDGARLVLGQVRAAHGRARPRRVREDAVDLKVDADGARHVARIGRRRRHDHLPRRPVDLRERDAVRARDGGDRPEARHPRQHARRVVVLNLLHGRGNQGGVGGGCEPRRGWVGTKAGWVGTKAGMGGNQGSVGGSSQGGVERYPRRRPCCRSLVALVALRGSNAECVQYAHAGFTSLLRHATLVLSSSSSSSSSSLRCGATCRPCRRCCRPLLRNTNVQR